MSISTATSHLASPRRMQPHHMVGALLLALGLIAVVVAIAISTSSTTSSQPPSARPATINPTPSQPTGAPVPSVPGATFRDPATHALLAVGSQAAPQADSSVGHRMNP